jgi:predicted porin
VKNRLAFILMGAACTVASAQSSVTVFGVVDNAVQRIKNGDESINGVASNGLTTSRIGFRGGEDLGDGLKAGFWLESGLNSDNGTQSDTKRFWNRRATVSLMDPKWGEIRLGRDLTPSYTAEFEFDPFEGNGVGSADKFQNPLGTTADTLFWADNLVAYYTPPGLGGFYGTLAAAAGEGTSGKKYYGGRIGFKGTSYHVTAATAQTTVTPDANGIDKYKYSVLSGSYDFTFMRLLGSWTQSKFGDLKLAVVNVGASIPLGSGRIRVGYAHVGASGRTASGVDTSNDDAHQVALGYVYDLSKRTALYGTASRVSNKGGAAYLTGSTPTLQLGRDSTGYEAGMRYSF